jgi:hypothetical protein
MDNPILTMLEKKLEKRKQEVIKLRWKQVELEKIKKEMNNKKNSKEI